MIMNVKKLLPYRFFTILLVVFSVTIFSCSNNSNTRDVYIGEKTDDPLKPPITFRGISIEGNETAIIDSLKNKGLEVKKMNGETDGYGDDVIGKILQETPNLYKRFTIYELMPKDKKDDKEFAFAYVVFWDGTLWQIDVVLSYDHKTDIGSIAQEFGNKFSASAEKTDGVIIPQVWSKFHVMYDGKTILMSGIATAKAAEKYIVKRGNTKVSIYEVNRVEASSGFLGRNINGYSDVNYVVFRYLNTDISEKINGMMDKEKNSQAQGAVDAL